MRCRGCKDCTAKGSKPLMASDSECISSSLNILQLFKNKNLFWAGKTSTVRVDFVRWRGNVGGTRESV